MNNLKASISKFLGNKNTVTILGVVLCLVILYIGYTTRINSQVAPADVPYAKVEIKPGTEITEDMIGITQVPKAFLNEHKEILQDKQNIVGKYSDYSTVIPAESFFYDTAVVPQDKLPNSAFGPIPSGYTVINYPVDIASTYANSMTPGSSISIYCKLLNDDGEVMFGKFISPVEVLDVKDASGEHVFESTEESRVPAFMLFAVPEEQHLLLRKALYLQREYDVELLLIPYTEELSQDSEPEITSDRIVEFIESKTEFVEVTNLPDFGTNGNGQVTPEDDTEE